MLYFSDRTRTGVTILTSAANQRHEPCHGTKNDFSLIIMPTENLHFWLEGLLNGQIAAHTYFAVRLTYFSLG